MDKDPTLLDNASVFYQPSYQRNVDRDSHKSNGESWFRIAMQVDGGRWALSSRIPSHGTVYGAVRVARTRWPRVVAPPKVKSENSAYELCYSVRPLEEPWGSQSRVMVISSRFLIRNDSRTVSFEVKQSGTADSGAIAVEPGAISPFHWANFRIPELISVRPHVTHNGTPVYRWSGGLDPLTIGATPLRVRKGGALNESPTGSQWNIMSVKVESEIRPRTGRTGINLCLHEEDETGSGSLFRIENRSCFPIWFSQDGLLVNHPFHDGHGDMFMNGDMIRPAESCVFALDVPFRQGKYAGRKSASMAELLRVRLALAPLSSRAGIETTKVLSISLNGERVRLNPSKLAFLPPPLRASMRRLRVLGIVANDGPTRVLRFWYVSARR